MSSGVPLRLRICSARSYTASEPASEAWVAMKTAWSPDWDGGTRPG